MSAKNYTVVVARRTDSQSPNELGTDALNGIQSIPGVLNCRIPDDCIDSKRYPLFMARDVMRVLIEQLQAEGATPS